jgi:hypothetical protein
MALKTPKRYSSHVYGSGVPMSYLQTLTFDKFQRDVTLRWSRIQKTIDAAVEDPAIATAINAILRRLYT